MADTGQGRPTIRDVAEAAGVATSTVSRAFSRPGRVSTEIAERIYRVARDLGYRSVFASSGGLPGASLPAVMPAAPVRAGRRVK